MAKHNNVGELGEAFAASYLQHRGYKILERNVQLSHQEIDLICLFQKRLKFVEVKTRTGLSAGYPESAVTSKKLLYLQKGILRYAQQRQIKLPWDLEVISVLLDNDLKVREIKLFDELTL